MLGIERAGNLTGKGPMNAKVMSLLSLLTLWTGVALGDPVLDQLQLDFSSGEFVHGDVSVAQTFTPSITGDLVQLNLFMSNHDTAEGLPLIISIYNTQNGVPSTQLATVSLADIGEYYSWYNVAFSGVYLTANNLYAFVLSAPGTFYGIYPGGSVNPNSYTRGMTLIQNGVGASWEPDTRSPQLLFETWMAVVPEPSNIYVGLALVFLCGVRSIAARIKK